MNAISAAVPPAGSAPRIAIFRALQLGDMLCAVPALRAMRAHWPDAEITLIGLPWARTFVQRYAALIDDIMVFPGAVGFPEQAETDAGLPEFYQACRARRFDLAVQLHGSGGVANDLVERFGAACNAGFVQPCEARREGVFIAWPETLPEAERYTALMRALGLPATDARLDFPLTGADHAGADLLIGEAGLEPERLVLIHPGAQLPSRRWMPSRFAEVADALAADGWQIAITGTAAESELTCAVLGEMEAPAIHLAGRTSLGALGALIARARLLVCNDTGVSHIAAAVRTASVVIASGSDTRRWAPADTALHRVLADWPVCRPCQYAVCPIDQVCSRNISSTLVVDTARAMLNGNRSAHRAAPFTLHEAQMSHVA